MIELRQAARSPPIARLLGEHRLGKPGEDVELERQRPVGGRGDARLELGKLERREAHDIGERLAVHEGLGMRRLGQDAGIGRGDLDEIAEHVVVADFQRFDAGRLRRKPIAGRR